MRFFKEDLTMPPDQELLFLQQTQKRTNKYFWAALIFVGIFQIYNIAFALYYTDFQLHTHSSRVYTVLYLFMLAVCLICATLGLLWRHIKKQPSRLLTLYAVFAFVLLLWSATLSLYDQRTSDNISIYISTSIYIASLIYIRPRSAVSIFLLAQGMLFIGFIWMELTGFKDTYGVFINSFGFTIVSLFISLYRYSSLRHDFKNHLEIEEKNRMILEQSQKLSHIANHDPLTGLWNRNYLENWKENFFQANSADSAANVAVFIIDIDYFKLYNDAFGHVAGDECLKRVAHTLQELDGLLFRFGGEEFLCLLPGATASAADQLALQFCHSIEKQAIPAASPAARLTVSVGYTIGNMNNELAFRQLLREADQALYIAKDSGRNRTVKYAAQSVSS